MYAIIDYHSIGFPPEEKYESHPDEVYGNFYSTSKNKIEKFWDIISKHYRGNNTVAFYELFNEPVADDGPTIAADWKQWKEFMERIIDVIRKNDFEKALIVAGLDHAYDLSQVLNNPIDRENIVYATHPYPDKNKWGRSWDEAFGSVKAQYPVFATEFGFDQEGYQEKDYKGNGNYSVALINYLEEKRISWTAWCFSQNWDPRLLKDKAYAPTRSGAFFRERLQVAQD